VLEPRILDGLRAGEAVAMPEILEEWTARGEHVSVHRLEEDWIDVGLPDELRRARGDLG